MYDSPRVLALFAGYSEKYGTHDGERHPENWAWLPNLLLDEWVESGYRFSSDDGFVYGGLNAEKSKPWRDELIAIGRRLHPEVP